MKSYHEKTSADNKSIGFDYQYYYFLYLLLNLKEGESIGIEVKDDIHMDLSNGNQVLLQLKHTIQTDSSGKSINLTELDKDLWKTIYNWVGVINDRAQGRDSLEKQIEFIKKTEFVLVSNKSMSNTNTFLKNVIEFKQGKKHIDEVIAVLNKLLKKTKDQTTKEYVNKLVKQDKKWIEGFLLNLRFELEQDDLINRIKAAIREKLVKEKRIDYVFESLDSNIRTRNYLQIKRGQKIIISFEDFRKMAEIYFEKARDYKLPIRKRKLTIDGNLTDQTFIKQLLAIEILENGDVDEMIRLTGYKLQTYSNLESWEQEGEITALQREQFDQECILQWRNTFNSVYRKEKKRYRRGEITEDKLIELAQDCYDRVMEKIIEFEDIKLDTELSNGQFYLLSDIPKIGWEINWEEKHK
ncbi:hypothetical protein [Anoxybacteroides rupiense]|uniref:hypothetical protein n=1 Tax=Anoxybacteroides rupiense TaxID=311460 RepID=UPI001605AF4E|nr:hypothetical protein [Anoxybacillus rupiensis]MBB3907315.1 hypothetical protein [Anoxybacillus rupiensis]